MDNNLDFLRAELSVLLVNNLQFADSIIKFQEALERRYNKRYRLEDIEKELEVLKVENDVMWDEVSNVKEISDDYFEGF